MVHAARDIAAARSRSYWLLSRLFLDQPDAALLREVAELLQAAGDADRGGAAACLQESALAALASPLVLTELQVEYTRLLGGASKTSGAPQPYESVAREGRLFGASAEAVAAAYVDAGHQELVSDTGPPDHVGTELRFLSLLCYHEMQAWESGDEDAATSFQDRELAFLDQHVLTWVPSLCDGILNVTEHPFYVALMRLTASACAADREDLASSLAEEPIR